MKKYVECPYCGTKNGPKYIGDTIKELPIINTQCNGCFKYIKWKYKSENIIIYKD